MLPRIQRGKTGVPAFTRYTRPRLYRRRLVWQLSCHVRVVLTRYNGCPPRSPSRGNVSHVFYLFIVYFILQTHAVGHQCDLKPSRIQRYLGNWCVSNTTSFRVPVGKLQKFTILFVVKLAGRCSICLLYTSPSPRDKRQSRMPSSA